LTVTRCPNPQVCCLLSSESSGFAYAALVGEPQRNNIDLLSGVLNRTSLGALNQFLPVFQR
jgi:hypothetical protein